MGVKRWLPGFVGRLLGSTVQSEADVRAELAFHIDGRAEELEASGLEPAEARRRAEAEFGDLRRIEEETRRVAAGRVRRVRWRDRWERVGGDVRFAVRTLVRNPRFTGTAVLTLGLGIGATTAVFTVVDAVLVRPLPYPGADRLVVVSETHPERGVESGRSSPATFLDYRAGGRPAVEALAAYEHMTATLTGVERAEALNAVGVTGDFFDVFGVPAAVGRTLRRGEAERRVVLSHGLWLRWFGGDPAVVGGAIQLDGAPAEVVGVMPPGFAIPAEETDLWIASGIEERTGARASRYLGMVGRLAPGVTPGAAESRLRVVASRLAAEHPGSNEGWTATVVPARDVIVGEARGVLLVLSGAVGLLLLLATVNVSNLLLGRISTRRSEMAVRSAVGATGGRLRAQLGVESLVLAVAAGAVGVAVAYAGVGAILRLEAAAIPRATEVGVDLRILLFALVVSLVASLLLGLAPAVRAGSAAPAEALAAGGRGGSGERRDTLRRGLIGLELALSLVLLVGAGLLFRSVLELGSVDPGYATENVLAAQVDLDSGRYGDRDARVTYFESLVERIEALPGVVSAGITTTLPLTRTGIDFGLPYRREGEPPAAEHEMPEVDYRIVSAGYREAMGIPLLRGRDLSSADRAETGRVALINRAFAETLWPGADPLGRRVFIHYIADDGLDWEIVGVIEDTRHTGVAEQPAPQIFIPMTQAEWLFDYMALVVRARAPSPGLAEALRDAALAVDPAEPLFDLQTMEALRAADVGRERLALRLLTLFATLALLLAATGVYAVVAYQVSRRTSEIGIRIALGARATDVVREVVGEVAGSAGLGLGAGLAAAMAAARLLEGLLFGVAPLDPLTLGAATALLFATTLAAAWLPARQAAAMDPVRALRAR